MSDNVYMFALQQIKNKWFNHGYTEARKLTNLFCETSFKGAYPSVMMEQARKLKVTE